MTALALSSMFAQQARFAHGAVFAHWAARAGYDAIELSHWTPREQGEAIRDAGVLPICGVHSPAPFRRDDRGLANSALNLAATDDTERRAAVAAAIESVRWAHELGATASVVHLGHVAATMPNLRELLRRAQAADPPQAGLDALRQAAVEERERRAGPFLEAAARSLAEIIAVAEPLGVMVGLESRLGFAEIPLPAECAALLAPYPATVAGWWADIGHVEVLHRLGLVDRSRWEACVGERLVGAHVHDVDGLRDHRAPGNGNIDWGAYAPLLRQLPSLTLEVDQREPGELVAGARAFLAARGLVA
ncbi:MAG: hypothetical protein Kow0010_00230 [Dehalococcoidia bacterium]